MKSIKSILALFSILTSITQLSAMKNYPPCPLKTVRDLMVTESTERTNFLATIKKEITELFEAQKSTLNPGIINNYINNKHPYKCSIVDVRPMAERLQLSHMITPDPYIKNRTYKYATPKQRALMREAIVDVYIANNRTPITKQAIIDLLARKFNKNFNTEGSLASFLRTNCINGVTTTSNLPLIGSRPKTKTTAKANQKRKHGPRDAHQEPAPRTKRAKYSDELSTEASHTTALNVIEATCCESDYPLENAIL